jgi:drug/metabolite transporter (DMT)-like permease
MLLMVHQDLERGQKMHWIDPAITAFLGLSMIVVGFFPRTFAKPEMSASEVATKASMAQAAGILLCIGAAFLLAVTNLHLLRGH